MSYILYDEDEWETIVQHRPCGVCQDDMRRCNGMCNGSSSIGQRRRAPGDVARIKAERLRKEEDEILRRADAIRAARAINPAPAASSNPTSESTT